MAVEPKDQKQGLLGLGFKAGNPLPLLEEAGIPGRVDTNGAVEWQVHDAETLFILNYHDLQAYLARKEDRLLQTIFRRLNTFVRALMGIPVRLNWGEGWPIETLPGSFSKDSFFKPWERAPQEIQSMVFEGAKAMYFRNFSNPPA